MIVDTDAGEQFVDATGTEEALIRCEAGVVTLWQFTRGYDQ